jgi:hypothetical protein
MKVPVEVMMCCHAGYAVDSGEKDDQGNVIPGSLLPSFIKTNALMSASTTMGLTMLVANEKMKVCVCVCFVMLSMSIFFNRLLVS